LVENNHYICGVIKGIFAIKKRQFVTILLPKQKQQAQLPENKYVAK
jgi:hypothetical protein